MKVELDIDVKLSNRAKFRLLLNMIEVWMEENRPVPYSMVIPDFEVLERLVEKGYEFLNDGKSEMIDKHIFEALIDLAKDYGRLSIEYDRDYGDDKRTGWTIVIDGSVVAELVPTLDDAFEKACMSVEDWEL